MIDVSSGGAAFTCHADEKCPYPGQQLTTRFSVPHFETDDAFDMANFVRHGHVCRVDHVNDFLRRIAIQFAAPLPFKPAELAESETKAKEMMMAITI